MAILHFKASYTKPAPPTVSSNISKIRLYDSPVWQLTNKIPAFTPSFLTLGWIFQANTHQSKSSAKRDSEKLVLLFCFFEDLLYIVIENCGPLLHILRKYQLKFRPRDQLSQLHR